MTHPTEGKKREMNIKHLPCVREVIHGSLVADIVMFFYLQMKLRLRKVDVCLRQR